MAVVTTAAISFMDWKTIYITGRPGFCDEVMKNLERSGIEFMSGYLTREDSSSHELFWVPESMALADFKRSVGARAVLRYRLHFFQSLDEFMEKDRSTELTAEDKRKIERMRLTDAA
jgi:hypothetical protein